MADTITQQLASLESFKDWSNYMLVTTVACLGWTAKEYKGQKFVLEIWLFALSILFAILTLALIPIIASQIDATTTSFYDISAKFNLIYIWGPQVSIRVKAICFIQHFLFLRGILRFAWHVSSIEKKGHIQRIT